MHFILLKGTLRGARRIFFYVSLAIFSGSYADEFDVLDFHHKLNTRDNEKNPPANLVGLRDSELIKYLKGKPVLKHHTPWTVLIVQLNDSDDKIIKFSCTGILMRPQSEGNVIPESEDTQSHHIWYINHQQPNWLLTAAHCLHGKKIENIRLVAGTIFNYSPGKYSNIHAFSNLIKTRKCKIDDLAYSDCKTVLNKCETIDSKEKRANFAALCDPRIRILSLEPENTYIHEEYNSETLANDIAIAKIKRFTAAQSDFIGSIAIPSPKEIQKILNHNPDLEHYIEQTPVQVYQTGFGLKNTIKVTHKTYKTFNYINDHSCRAQYKAAGLILPKNIICAGSREGFDVENICEGDSGSALYTRKTNMESENNNYFLLGIASRGESCRYNETMAALPSTFTRVSSYYLWLYKKIMCVQNKNFNPDICKSNLNPEIFF